MISKNTISFVRSLHQKKFRSEHQLFIVEGIKMVDELIESNFEIHSLYATDKWIDSKYQPISKNQLTQVTEKELAQFSLLNTPNEILAVVHQQKAVFENNFKKQYYLALDSISDPGNMGSIIRIADWFGINELFYSPECVDIYNPKVVQATMGSIFRVKTFEMELTDLLELNNQTAKLPVLGAVLNGKNVFKHQLPSHGIIIIGNESRGISPLIQKYFTHPVLIPSFNSNHNSAESLNAAVATGIICAELKRQQMRV